MDSHQLNQTLMEAKVMSGFYQASRKERRWSCCPEFFERSSKSWWDPKFDSEILEGQFTRSTFPQVRLRFQYALLYIFLASLTWCLYFAIAATSFWPAYVVVSLLLLFTVMAVLMVTITSYYEHHFFAVSMFVSVLISIVTLSVHMSYYFVSDTSHPDMSEVGQFVLCVETVLLVYTVVPLPLYLCVSIGICYSVLFELLTLWLNPSKEDLTLIVRILVHMCVHTIGGHILVMTQVRMRGTFMKVGQLLMVRRELELEKQIKEKMIHSIMPPKVADWLMKEGHECEEVEHVIKTHGRPGHRSSHDMKAIFRPFNMNKMDNVSILFADIVGFTSMSSNKTADHVVGLLNDLFGRFDHLCVQNGCEKIALLGDCYYCVSGCPEPKEDHAHSCVETGLGMIQAVKQFDKDRNETINMRVGVHTGTVLCGIVGTKRFKFDVWSNDVTLANQMESTGKPGRVHVTEKTLYFLSGDYFVQPGDMHHGLKTYFILGRRTDIRSVDMSADIDPFLPPSPLRKMPSQPPIGQKRPVNPGSSKKCSSLPSILDNYTSDPLTFEEVKQAVREQGREIKEKSREKKRKCKKSRDPEAAKAGEDDVTKNKGMVENELEEEHAGASLLAGEKPVVTVNSSWSTINSRKDSGIRSSNSRHSSVLANILLRTGSENGDAGPKRVSDYWSSKTSIDEDVENESCSLQPQIVIVPIQESINRFHHLRKQSDLQLIKCVQEDESHRSYFLRPPLSQVTLEFLENEMEQEYRSLAHKPDVPGEVKTLASPTFNTYFDVIVSALTFFLTATACFMLLPVDTPWKILSALGAVVNILVMILCVLQLTVGRSGSDFGKRIAAIYEKCMGWRPWHAVGAILISFPVLGVLANFSCDAISELNESNTVYGYVFCLGLVHFCNFTQLNCWMKSVIATVCGLIYVGLIAGHVCPCPYEARLEPMTDNETLASSDLELFDEPHMFHYEIVIDVLLLLLLIWYLNREFEISFRMSFHCNVVASRGKAKVQAMKNQADWLLNNIMPQNVVEVLKNTAKYSENHKNVGIIFASIVNFNEMYDETYFGGKEYLRFLNELIGDFDELLNKPEFRNVDKIKTIGSTYMAASGLDPELREQNSHPNQHLHELMEFALAMQSAVEDFNRDLLEFNLVIRVGYNVGDVTSGVLGTSKLLYDIWGDAVNIASRMDSTGVNGRIQLPEAVVPMIDDPYETEERGTVFVKGKNNMNVFLVKGRKTMC